MRILVEPSDYITRNVGDTAMMTVALERLSDLLPDARIQVLTDEPEEMPRPGSNIEPLSLIGRRLWFNPLYADQRVSQPMLGLSHQLGRVIRWLRRSHPTLAYHALCQFGGLTAQATGQLAGFFEAISEADLLVVTGMGGVTSAFPIYAFELLEVIHCAQHFGAKTAMLGQGLGPIEIKELRSKSAAVLQKLDLLALRERRAGLPLLKGLDVPLERVVVTGDDAIELVCRHTADITGFGIGVNLRHANYAGICSLEIEEIGVALRKLSDWFDAPLIGIPISRVSGEEDRITIAELIRNRDIHFNDLSGICRPEDVILQLQKCRVIVAGSYHAGVFALASGIPTVAVVKSQYYIDKFLGLADMFGLGCRVISLSEPHFSDRLIQAVLDAWDSADRVKAPLLAAAQHQVNQSRAAYSRVKALLE